MHRFYYSVEVDSVHWMQQRHLMTLAIAGLLTLLMALKAR
jgi:hypothetical protein